MSKNRLPNALPPVPVQLDLNTPGAVEKLFYGERHQPDETPSEPHAAAVTPAVIELSPSPRVQTPPTSKPLTETPDEFAAALERLKALGPRGERPHHVHLPDSLDIALRRFAADRKTKATNVLIVALMTYLDAQAGSDA